MVSHLVSDILSNTFLIQDLLFFSNRFYKNMTRADFLLLLAARVTGVSSEEEIRLRELEIMLHADDLKVANGSNFSYKHLQ